MRYYNNRKVFIIFIIKKTTRYINKFNFLAIIKYILFIIIIKIF